MENFTLKCKLSFLLLFVGFNVQAQIPADLMRNCNQWKITYPTGVEEKQLCDEDNNEFFYVNNAEDGIVFRAPIRSDNGTTPNSSYIRSELRERTEDGSKDIYWTTEGRHVVYVEQAITHLPIVKSHLVATQIHGDKAAGTDDALVLRLEDEHLFLSFNGGKLRSDVTVKTDYQLGTKHEVIFEVVDDKHYVYYSEEGNLWEAYASGNATQYLVKDNGNPVLMDIYYDQSYFKIGNYTQSNPDREGDETDNPDNYGEVVVYDFIVEHGESEPAAVSGVELTPATATVALDGTKQLNATVLPSNAANKNVSYASSNTSVATIDANGLVTAVSEGTAIITVTTNEGNYTATSEITVQDIPQGLENIALNKPVTTTGTPDTGAEADNLVDGDTETRVSVQGYPQTFTIDLGANYDMSYSELVFYEERAYQYTISTATSEEGPYTEVVNRTGNTTAGTAANPLSDYFTSTGRYVQITVTGADNYTGDWISIMEFRVYGEETLITFSFDQTLGSGFAIYPIPAKDVLHFELQATQGADQIKVYDLTGNMLYSETISENQGTLNISTLPKGMYLLKIEGQTTYIKRFTKL